MPYIKQEDRKKLDPAIDQLIMVLNDNHVDPQAKGMYNYVITRLAHSYIDFTGKKYAHLNDMIGILECAKQEFYRKVISPYEEEKFASNFGVSDLDAL